MAQKYEGDERRQIEPPGWHLDKKVPISLLAVLMMQGVAGIWAFADLKKDVELLKADSAVLHSNDTRAAQDFRDSLIIIRDQIGSLNNKLDRLIERSK